MKKVVLAISIAIMATACKKEVITKPVECNYIESTRSSIVGQWMRTHKMDGSGWIESKRSFEVSITHIDTVEYQVVNANTVKLSNGDILTFHHLQEYTVVSKNGYEYEKWKI